MHPVFTQKSKKSIFWPYRLLLFCLVIFLMAVAVKPLLIQAGKILYVPQSEEQAQAILLEGGRLISTFFMNGAITAWQNGQAEKIIILESPEDKTPEVFGLVNYKKMVRAALDSLGVPDSALVFIPLELTDPYTRNAALQLGPILSAQQINSVLIINDNFHIRRSYLAYKKVFAAYDIAVYPYTMEIYLDAYTWWKSANGWRRVFGEYIKLIFYKVHNYI